MHYNRFNRELSEADREKDARELADTMAKLAAANEEKYRDWCMFKFITLGFHSSAAELLTSWKVDHHRVERMLSQGCTRGLVMDIFSPELDGAEAPEPELLTVA